MRLLMIAHSVAPWTPGFASFFTARGDVLRLVSFSPQAIDGVVGIDSVFVGIDPFDPCRNKHMFLTCVPRIRRVVRDFQPDLVFAPYLVSNGLSAVLSWKGPTVVYAVGTDVLNHEGRTGWRLRLHESAIRFVCRRADSIYTVSQELSDELVRLGVPPSKVVQVPLGPDTQEFHPDASMPRAEATRFICTRKHEKIYDIATIIDALARLKARGRRFHCTFTSGGTLLASHEARAQDAGLGPCVTFTGNLERRALPELLRRADIYISASHGDGTSVSLLEAMASGLLPVVSRIRANLPWVEHGRTGLLFECGKPADLAEALGIAMDGEALRRSAFEQNRARVCRDADMHRGMGTLRKCFEQLVAARRAT